MPKCPVCKGTEFEDTEPIIIRLPSALNGKGTGNLHGTLTATVNLPFLTCKECRTVLNPKKEE